MQELLHCAYISKLVYSLCILFSTYVYSALICVPPNMLKDYLKSHIFMCRKQTNEYYC